MTLNDAHAIAYYVANDQLRGTDLAHRANVLQWINYAAGDLYHDVVTYAYPLLGLLDSDEKVSLNYLNLCFGNLSNNEFSSLSKKPRPQPRLI